MSIALTCPSCGNTSSVADDLAGKIILCRACRESLPVPATLKVSPATHPAKEPSPKAPPVRARRWVVPWASFRLAAWLLCLAGWLTGSTLAIIELVEAKTVFQQSAAAAFGCFAAVASYVFARCVEEITKAIERGVR